MAQTQQQTQPQQRKITAPPVNPETQAFWDAAGDGKLLYKKCAACGEPHFYPRPHCPFCFSDKVEWQEASGRGTIYTYSVMRRAPVPYAIAYVELAEGPRMMTNIVGCPQTPEALVLDMALEVTFERQTDQITLPLFKPAAGQ